MLILCTKAAQKLAFFVISTLFCKMAQLYDESPLKISLDKDISASFMPAPNLPKEIHLMCYCKWPVEKKNALATKMLPDLPPQPKPEPEPMQVSNAAHSDSELSIEDFEVPANSLVLRQIHFPVRAMHIFSYLTSVILNHDRPCWPWSSASWEKKTGFKWKTRNYTMQYISLRYFHMNTDRTTKVKMSKYLKLIME